MVKSVVITALLASLALGAVIPKSVDARAEADALVAYVGQTIFTSRN